MKMVKAKGFIVIFITIMLLCGGSAFVVAQEPEQSESAIEQEEFVEESNLDVHQPNSPLDELADYFDQYFLEQMRVNNIPGLAFAFVYEGNTITRGYGFADVENAVVMDPLTTLFPMEDISKVLTATAVLQLADTHAVDLHQDINDYLTQIEIPDRYPQPLTLAHILTYTSGFADDGIGKYARTPKQVQPLVEYLEENMPEQILPPGAASTYGDYGYGLAGLVIETVGRLSFTEYMQKHILAPLQMERSNFTWDAVDRDQLAVGYVLDGGVLTTGPEAYPHNLPASSLVSTVGDMAHYLMMQLNGGKFNNQQVISPASLDLMQNTQFQLHPQMPGWTMGFYAYQYQGKRVLLHGSDCESGYSTVLFILPEANLGMVVAINRYLPGFGTRVVNDFLHWLYPVAKAANVVPHSSAVERSKWFVGNYALDYPLGNGLTYLRRLFTQIHVTIDEDGVYHIDFPPETGLPSDYVEIEPLLLRAVDEETYVAFIMDDYGKVTHLYAGGPYSYGKLSYHKSMEITLIAATAYAGIFLLQCLVWLVRKVRANRMRVRIWDRFHLNMATLLSLVNLVFLSGIVYMYFHAQELLYGISPFLIGLSLLPIVSAVLTVIMLILGPSIDKRRWSFALRLYYGGLQIIFITFILYLWNWNLISL